MWKDIIVLVGWTNPLRDELFVSDWYPESGDERLALLDTTNGYFQIGSKSPNKEHLPPNVKENFNIDLITKHEASEVLNRFH